MNITKHCKTLSKTIPSQILIFSLLLLPLYVVAGTNPVNVSINGSKNLKLNQEGNGSISDPFNYMIYNYSGDRNEVQFSIDEPIVCTSKINSTNPVVLKAIDPNDIYSLGDQNNIAYDGISAFVYDINTGRVSITTDEFTFCASKNGLHMNTDSIFEYGFDERVNDIEIELFKKVAGNYVPFSASPKVADGQPFNYKYVVTNHGTVTQYFDLVEFHKNYSDTTPYLVDPDSDNQTINWSCNSISTNNGFCKYAVEPPTFLTTLEGHDLVMLDKAALKVGGSLTVTVEKQVEFPSGINVGSAGTEFELLAAVFPVQRLDLAINDKVDKIPNNNSVYQQFNSTNNSDLIFEFASNSINAIEDGNTIEIPFTIRDDDLTEDELNNIVIIVSSMNTAIIEHDPLNTSIGSPILEVVNGTQIIGDNKSAKILRIKPKIDANTQTSGSIILELIGNDTIADFPKNVNLSITPVNDQPSFTLNCNDHGTTLIYLAIDGSSTSCSTAVSSSEMRTDISGLVKLNSIGFGANGTEIQNIEKYETRVISDPDNLIISDATGNKVVVFDSLSNTLTIAQAANKEGKSAVLGIILVDDAGTSNNGINTSIEQIFTLEVPVPVYSIKTNITVTNNGGILAASSLLLKLESSSTQTPQTATATGTDSNLDIGTLLKNSDFTLSIATATSGNLDCNFISSNIGTVNTGTSNSSTVVAAINELTDDVIANIECSVLSL